MSARRPGVYTLADFTLTTAGQQTATPITLLEGMVSATLSARLAYGSGGTGVTAIVETSLNQGLTWVEIARFDFTTAGAEKILNVSAGQSVPLPLAAGSLPAEGTADGVLGDRLRARCSSTGTYAGQTVLSLRATVR